MSRRDRPSAYRAVGDVAGDQVDFRREAGSHESSDAAESAAHRSDEGARRVERQRVDVVAEVAPYAVLPQVLFDVRYIERGHDRFFLPQVCADGADRLRSPEV